MVSGFLMLTNVMAQYDPGAVNYGLVGVKNLSIAGELGIGARIEYAHNCYTTYMAEYNRFLDVDGTEEGYNEIAVGVNLILFNWYPTTITAGFGYIANTSAAFEAIEEDAFIGFTGGGLNHGAQIKLRALHQVSIPIHIFAELNLKSLGTRYHTVAVGFSYDFNAW